MRNYYLNRTLCTKLSLNGSSCLTERESAISPWYVTLDNSSFFSLLPVIKGYKRQISVLEFKRAISISCSKRFDIRNCVAPVEKYAIGKRYFTRSGFRGMWICMSLQYIGRITIFMRLVTPFFVLALRNLAHRTVPKFDPRCPLNP